MPSKSKNIQAHFLALFTVLIWGVTFVASKILLNESFSPFEILVLRFAIAYLVLFAIRPRFIRLSSLKDEIPYMICGVFGVTLYFLAENTALVYTLVSNVGILVSVAPFLTALLMWAVYKDRPSGMFLLGFLVAICGVMLVSFNGMHGFDFSFIGVVLAILAAAVWAVYSVAMRRINDSEQSVDMILVTRRIFFWALVSMVPLLSVYGFDVDIDSFSAPSTWLSLLLLAVGGSSISYVTWNCAMKVLGEVRASAYIYAVPALNLVFAAIILHESITGEALIGITLITIGLLISEQRKRPATLQVPRIVEAEQAYDPTGNR
ncbi:MAG: DMT family transporter [Actinobacteria bacterium]|nr:DMT family transporter [Actinomycetota bacterium]